MLRSICPVCSQEVLVLLVDVGIFEKFVAGNFPEAQHIPMGIFILLPTPVERKSNQQPKGVANAIPSILQPH
jgi:hypothetical protein